MESRALAAETSAATSLTEPEALKAAETAVAEAHGDLGVGDANDHMGEHSSDVARPSDVVAVDRQQSSNNSV